MVTPRNTSSGAGRSQALTWMPVTSVARRKHRVYWTAQFLAASLAGINGAFGAYLMLLSWPHSLGQIRDSRFDVISVVVALLRVPFTDELRPFLPFIALSAILFPAMYRWFGVIAAPSGRIIPFGHLWGMLKATTTTTVLLYFLYGSQLIASSFPARHYAVVYFIYFGAVAYFSAILLRSGLLSFVFFLRSMGIGHTRVAIVAKSDPAELREAIERPDSEHLLVGTISVRADEQEDARFAQHTGLGDVRDLPAIINRERIDEVLLAVDPGELTIEQRTAVAETCWKLGVELKMVTPFHPYFRTTARTEILGDVTLLRVEPSGLYTTRSQLLKRFLDIVISASALITLSPILAVIGVLIKTSSPGPVLFVQERPGLHGRVFRILKFRTMRAGASTDAHREAQKKLIQDGAPSGYDVQGRPIYGKVANDPRVTLIGKWLRRTSVDELPQLWNVLRGEMSLVGPRPAVLADLENFKEWHHQRHDIRPGLTGLWQVSGRSRLSFDQMVALDIKYIEEWSLLLDLKIILMTIPALLKTDQAF